MDMSGRGLMSQGRGPEFEKQSPGWSKGMSADCSFVLFLSPGGTVGGMVSRWLCYGHLKWWEWGKQEEEVPLERKGLLTVQ